MRDQRVRTGEIEMQVREYEHEGDAVIFLHFGGGNLMMWQRAVPYFQERYRLILPDLRGHGKTDKPHEGNEPQVMARDIAGLMQVLGIEKAHVVGSSPGAEVGLCLAAAHPERVISLACDGALSSEFGPYSTWEGTEEEFKAHVASQVEEMRATPEPVFPSIEARVKARRDVFEPSGWWNENFDRMTHYDVWPLGDGQYTRGFRKWSNDEYMERYFSYRFEDFYRRMQCPVLMLADKDDMENERTRAAMEGLRDLAPQARIVEVPGWMHPYGWLLDEKAICEIILSFLEENSCKG